MALSISFVKDAETYFGKLRALTFDVTFDASYPTGGEAFAASNLPGKLLKSIFGCLCIGGNAAAGAYMLRWNSTTKKLMVFYPTGGAAAPAALADPISTTPVLTHTAGATPVTSSAATQPDHAATAGTVTAGRGKELANATDASTLTFRVLVYGF